VKLNRRSKNQHRRISQIMLESYCEALLFVLPSGFIFAVSYDWYMVPAVVVSFVVVVVVVVGGASVVVVVVVVVAVASYVMAVQSEHALG
jgi:hypothetical protein